MACAWRSPLLGEGTGLLASQNTTENHRKIHAVTDVLVCGHCSSPPNLSGSNAASASATRAMAEQAFQSVAVGGPRSIVAHELDHGVASSGLADDIKPASSKIKTRGKALWRFAPDGARVNRLRACRSQLDDQRCMKE